MVQKGGVPYGRFQSCYVTEAVFRAGVLDPNMYSFRFELHLDEGPWWGWGRKYLNAPIICTHKNEFENS